MILNVMHILSIQVNLLIFMPNWHSLIQLLFHNVLEVSAIVPEKN